MNPSTLVVIAKFSIMSGHADFFLRAAERVISSTRKEAGCIEYNLYRQRDDANVFTFIELWQNTVALERHLASPHVEAFLTETRDALASEIDVSHWHAVR